MGLKASIPFLHTSSNKLYDFLHFVAFPAALKSWSGTKSEKEGFVTSQSKKLKLRDFFIDLGCGLYYKVMG